MSVEEKISELLELIRTTELNRKEIKKEEIAAELKYPLLETEKIIDVATTEGLIQHNDGVFRLTDKGYMAVQHHRESYIHERFTHQPAFLGRLSRVIDGGIKDWQGHWRRRHSFDEESLNEFYKGIQGLEGHVEDTLPLANLDQGEHGHIVLAFGGRGLVRRLTEMGLTPGTEVTLTRKAPFHGPVEVKVRDISLALGYGVASKVLVKRVKEAD